MQVGSMTESTITALRLRKPFSVQASPLLARLQLVILGIQGREYFQPSQLCLPYPLSTLLLVR